MIQSYYVWIATGEDGEYTLGAGVGDNLPMPMVFANQDLAVSVKPIAKAHFEATGEKVTLIKYRFGEVLDVIE